MPAKSTDSSESRSIKNLLSNNYSHKITPTNNKMVYSNSNENFKKSPQTVGHRLTKCTTNFPTAKHDVNISTVFGCICNDCVHNAIKSLDRATVSAK